MKPKFRNLATAFAPLSRTSVIVVASLCAAAIANADQTWTGAFDNNWNDLQNWTSAVPGGSDVAIFDATSGSVTPSLSSASSVLGVQIVDPSGTVTIGGTSSLSIGSSGLNLSTATQNLSISAPVTLAAAQSWNVATGRTVTVTGILDASANALTKSGAGSATLNNTGNTTTAGIIVAGGTLTGQAGASGNVSLGVGPITLQGGGILTGNPGSGNNTWVTTNTWTIADGQSGRINTPNRMQMRGAVSGAGTLDFNVSSTVARMDMQNSWTGFSGQVNFIGSGTVRLGINPLGSGQPAMNASSWQDSTVNLGGSVALAPNTNSGGNTVHIGSLTGASATANLNDRTAGGAATWSIGGLDESTTYAGGIRGINNLTKVGSGSLTLTATANLDYSGLTNVSGGTLVVMGTKSGAGASSVNDGATLSGTGSIAGTTTIASGGILAPGDAGAGNLSFGSLTMASGSTLLLGATPDTSKPVVLAGGTLTLSTGANVDVGGFGTEGTYDIIDITGATLSGSAATALTATNTEGGKVYTFSSTTTSVQLTISGSDPSNYWNLDDSGTWNLGTNWTKGTIPNAPGAIAKIGPGAGGAGGAFTPLDINITLDGDQTVGVLTFDDDFGSSVTIDAGTPAGSLLMDNSGGPSNIVVVTGEHVINAPVVMNSEGAVMDIGSPHKLAVNGVISGSGSVLSKSGTGVLEITGDNSFSGGTILGAGTLEINSATSLGDLLGALRFSGGTLRIANDLFGISRSFQIAGTNNANIDTNEFNFAYDGVISPFSGGTGGLTKIGAGNLTLSAAQTYTGVTTVSAGVLELATGSSISGTSLVFGTTGGTLFHVNGGTFNGTTSSVTAGTAGFLISSGSATFSGALNAQDNATGVVALIKSDGGTLSAASMAIGRSSNAVLTEPTAGATNSGLLVQGETSIVNLSGNLSISGSNSTANARIDAGTVTVGGTTTIGLNNTGRWSVLDVNGGTFNCANTATGVQVGNGQAGNAIFLVQDGGVANVGRITFNNAQAVAYNEFVRLSGGSLYVGAGGMAKIGTNDLVESRVYVDGGTLGASASWTSTINTTLTGTTSSIKAADSLNAPFDITLSGVVDGTGDLNKTGAGKLTLSGVNLFSGATNVSEGTLSIEGDNSGATGEVDVLSGATLGGSGNIGGNVTIQSGGHQAIAVAATSGAQPTRTITGILNLAGGDIVDLTAAATPEAGSYVLVTATGGITGDLNASTINYNGITGTLSVSGTSLVLTVTGGGYSSWATANGATGQTPGQDHDGDGVDNGVEYFMGETGSSFTSNPAPNSSNLITWPKDPAFSGTYTVQKSTDLAVWTDVSSADSGSSVSYTITGPDKQFVRLLVTPN